MIRKRRPPGRLSHQAIPGAVDGAGGRQAGKWALLLGAVGILGYGIWSYTGLPDGIGGAQAQSAAGGVVERYGAPLSGAHASLPIAAALAKGTAAVVTLQGKVVDQGPLMGCWVRIRDSSSDVIVQTNPMAFMPQRLRGATVQVTGTLVHGRFAGMGYTGPGTSSPIWFLLTPGVEVVSPAAEGTGA